MLSNLELVEMKRNVKTLMVSQFNGTSTPKGTHSAKTGDNDRKVNSNATV